MFEVGSLVLGIDPGTRHVGYGLIRMRKRDGEALDFGCFDIDAALPFPGRLKQIHESIRSLIQKAQPDMVAVEEVFVSQNAKTTLKLGHARGVILLAAALEGVPVAEYAPREIKQAVIGKGNASKHQMQWMIRQTFHLDSNSLAEDAADALAVALCHGLRSGAAVVTRSGGCG